MGSEFGGTWEDPEGCFFIFAEKRALKQDQIVHMEGKFKLFSTSAGSEGLYDIWKSMKYECIKIII